jgi:hypothetical protein
VRMADAPLRRVDDPDDRAAARARDDSHSHR